jgi:hypothetical protein
MEENQEDMDLTSQGAGTYWYLLSLSLDSGPVYLYLCILL